jgi:predicted aconitase with swiveling domain
VAIDSCFEVRRVLLEGEAKGELLRLDKPISFWGGVDPKTGCIIDPRHPQSGCSVEGRILAMERVIGSSSGSSVMMELLAIGKAPSGLILAEVDAILTLGVVVGREMGYGSIPVFLVSLETLGFLPSRLRMTEDGLIEGCTSAASVQSLSI